MGDIIKNIYVHAERNDLVENNGLAALFLKCGVAPRVGHFANSIMAANEYADWEMMEAVLNSFGSAVRYINKNKLLTRKIWANVTKIMGNLFEIGVHIDILAPICGIS